MEHIIYAKFIFFLDFLHVSGLHFGNFFSGIAIPYTNPIQRTPGIIPPYKNFTTIHPIHLGGHFAPPIPKFTPPMPHGITIWHCHLALPSGIARWQCHLCHMATPYGNAIWQPRPRLPPRPRPMFSVGRENFFRNFSPEK